MQVSEPSPDAYGEAWAGVYDETHADIVAPDSQIDLLAGLAADGRALELGIGTGRIALPLAVRGVRVEGVDASPSMVAKLRAKPGGTDIPVEIGDFVDPPVQAPYRLVYVPFNTFFELFTQEAQVRCFATVAGLLEPGGAFCLEAFVPELGRFDRGQSVRVLRLEEGTAHIDASTHDPTTQQIVAQRITLTDGVAPSILPIDLRYAWPSELDLMARLAGLDLEARYGGWNREPFTADSRNHVSLYRKPG